MIKVSIKIAALVVLFLLPMYVSGQYSTDDRIIYEHMRYSREKSFNSWSMSLGYGSLIMYNDLADYTIFPTHWNFGPSIMIAKQVYPAWAFDLQFLSGAYRAGNAMYYSKGELLDFSFNSRTYINQLLAMPGPLNDHWNFYFKIGVGLSAFRTRVHYTDTHEVVHYGDFGEENADDGYVVLGYDRHDPYKKINRAKELIIPVGFGVQYRINRSFDIGFESTMRLSLEDKLDNILVGSENDKYWSNTISISYKIGKKDKRHSKWTYRGYGINVFGAPKNDPLVDEIRVLEDELRTYKEGKVVKTDSVTNIHNAKKIYGTANLVTVFFKHKEYNEVEMEALVELAALALNMVKNKSWTAEIYGYANDEDDEEANQMISQKRCERVLQFFVRDLGLSTDRFEIKAQGSDDVLPTDLHSSKGKLSINRRVDVVLKK